jgi:glucose-1-phosphate thymidylyltransferase
VDIILPVAGLGSRLRPHTWTKPKPLVSLAGKPILEHVLDRVLPLRPSRLVFITGYLGDQIEAWARERYPEMDLSFVAQPEMKGQTDAIVRTRDLVSGDALILFPDMLFEADFSGLRDTDADAVMFTKWVEDPSALGIAVVEEGRITKLVEKPKDPISNLAVIGIYYIREMPKLYAAIDEQMRLGISLKNEYFIADAIQLMIDGGARVVTAPVTEWEDCGSVENLLATNAWLLDRMRPEAPSVPGAVVIPPSVVDASAVLEHCVVGPHASIAAGVTVRGAVLRDCVVEANATIEGVVAAHALIGRRARVTGSPTALNVGDDSWVTA